MSNTTPYFKDGDPTPRYIGIDGMFSGPFAGRSVVARESDYDALLAERDALRADAERYRWICNGNGYFMEEHGICGRWSEGHPEDKAEADKVIDAQMRKSPVEGGEQK